MPTYKANRKEKYAHNLFGIASACALSFICIYSIRYKVGIFRRLRECTAKFAMTCGGWKMRQTAELFTHYATLLVQTQNQKRNLRHPARNSTKITVVEDVFFFLATFRKDLVGNWWAPPSTPFKVDWCVAPWKMQSGQPIEGSGMH